MTQLKALLIEWNQNTGIRAGNINPRDPKLRCNGWQNMDVTPAIELRLVEDDRDSLIYENVDGVEVLTGSDIINEAIINNFKSKIIIDDELIYTEHVKDKISKNEIDIDKLSDNRDDRLKQLMSKGVKGIKEIKPMMV